MRINRLSIELYIAFLLLAAALVGCNEENGNVDADVQTAIDTGNAQGAALASQAQTELAQDTALVAIAKVGSIIHTINDGEIMTATVALGLTANTSTQLYANRMITDHSASSATLEMMLNAMQIFPQDNSVSAALRDETSANISQLQRTASADVPRIYLRMQIQTHQEALVLVGAFVNISTGTSFDQFIGETLAMLASHRDEAEQRLRTLGL